MIIKCNLNLIAKNFAKFGFALYEAKQLRGITLENLNVWVPHFFNVRERGRKKFSLSYLSEYFRIKPSLSFFVFIVTCSIQDQVFNTLLKVHNDCWNKTPVFIECSMSFLAGFSKSQAMLKNLIDFTWSFIIRYTLRF